MELVNFEKKEFYVKCCFFNDMSIDTTFHYSGRTVTKKRHYNPSYLGGSAVDKMSGIAEDASGKKFYFTDSDVCILNDISHFHKKFVAAKYGTKRRRKWYQNLLGRNS